MCVESFYGTISSKIGCGGGWPGMWIYQKPLSYIHFWMGKYIWIISQQAALLKTTFLFAAHKPY